MRSGSPVLQPGRLSPAEELQNRRKIRLTQVRQQEQLIAKRVRDQVKQEKLNELKNVAHKLTEEFEGKRAENYAASKETYAAGLSQFGKAHEAASCDVTDQALCAAIWEQQKKIAKKRFCDAINHVHLLKSVEEQNQLCVINKKKLVAKKEMVRAKQIAMLPKKDPTNESDPEQPKSETTIITNDTQSIVVERAPYEEKMLQDAKTAAAEEEIRSSDIEKDKTCKLAEQIERAHVRHLAALQKTRMTREYAKLETDMKQLQRKAALSRKHGFSNFPGSSNAGVFKQPTEMELLETLGIPQGWYGMEREAEEPEAEITPTITSKDSYELMSSQTADSTSVEAVCSSNESVVQTSGSTDPLSVSFEDESTFVDSTESEHAEWPDHGEWDVREKPQPLQPRSVLKQNDFPLKKSFVRPKKNIAFDIPPKVNPILNEYKANEKEISETPFSETNYSKLLAGGKPSSDPVSRKLGTEKYSLKSVGTVHLNTDVEEIVQSDAPVPMSSEQPHRFNVEKQTVLLKDSDQDAQAKPLHSDTKSSSHKSFLSSEEVTKALEHPDVKEFQKKILEAYSSNSPSANNSLHQFTRESEPFVVSKSGDEMDEHHATTQLSDSGAQSTIIDNLSEESVEMLEDGLDNIASGISKREAELIRQQALLEDYKARLIQQQKQHAALTKLSARHGQRLARDQVVTKGNYNFSTTLSNGEKAEQENAHTFGLPSTSKNALSENVLESFHVPSLLLMSNPNPLPDASQVSGAYLDGTKSAKSMNSEMSDSIDVQEISSSTASKSSAASFDILSLPVIPPMDIVQHMPQPPPTHSLIPRTTETMSSGSSLSVHVHEISSNSAKQLSLTSGSSAIVHEKLSSDYSLSTKSHTSFSFVELSPNVDADGRSFSVEQNDVSSAPVAIDEESFTELQPDLTAVEKVGTWADELNPNLTSFTELTPCFSDLQLKEFSDTESPSAHDISEHPLSTHDEASTSCPPLSHSVDTNSVQVHSESEENLAESPLTEVSWKSLLVEPLSQPDSVIQIDDPSLEIPRDESGMFENVGGTLSGGIFEEPDLTLVSLNSTVVDNTLGTGLDLSSRRNDTIDFHAFNNRAAISIEKLPSPSVSVSGQPTVTLPESSDQYLENLLAYVKQLELEK